MLPTDPETLRALVRRVAVWVLLLLLAGRVPVEGQPPARAPRAPKLVVLIAVDQLRGDYLERYGARFTGGLKRLTTEGAWFQKAMYPYLNTVTCAGHATIATGTLPYRHGLILNQIYDRAAKQSPYCTADAAVKDFSFNGLPPPAVGNSPAMLLVPTLHPRCQSIAPTSRRASICASQPASGELVAILGMGHRNL